MSTVDAQPWVIIGAGPAGLCAAGHVRRVGGEPVILEASEAVGGVWRWAPDSLRCLSRRDRDRLPDGTTPTGRGLRARADEVRALLRGYAEREAFAIRTGARVERIVRDERRGAWRVTWPGGGLAAQRLIVATGAYARPRPPCADVEVAADGTLRHPDFAGLLTHFRHLDDRFLARLQPRARVLVIGQGNSAAWAVAAVRARLADVWLSTRSPLRPPAAGPGSGLLDAVRFELSGVPLRLVPGRLGCADQTPVIDRDLVDGVADGAIIHVSETLALTRRGARTRHHGEVVVDAVVACTGFDRAIPPLEGLAVPLSGGLPRLVDGVAVDVPGLAVVGQPCQRTRRSGFLRGLADDARIVVDALAHDPRVAGPVAR